MGGVRFFSYSGVVSILILKTGTIDNTLHLWQEKKEDQGDLTCYNYSYF